LAPASALAAALARGSETAAEGRPALVHRAGEDAGRAARAAPARPHAPAARRFRQAVAAPDQPRNAFLVGVTRARLPLVVDFVRRQLAFFLGFGAIADRVGRILVAVVPIGIVAEAGHRLLVVVGREPRLGLAI